MSGELARAVREWTESNEAWLTAAERDPVAVNSANRHWSLYALPGSCGFVHANFVRRDERVPIPQRGKDG